jgi:hydroxylamine dehydrogenase
MNRSGLEKRPLLKGEDKMKRVYPITSTVLLFLLVSIFSGLSFGGSAPLSEDSEMCMECHVYLHPGIAEDWEQSSHADTTPAQALTKSELARLISANPVPEEFAGYAVGCAECHTMNPDQHSDSFEHAGYQVHTVVTPADCSQCHPVEVDQYKGNLMSHAYGNLQENSLYRSLADSINGIDAFEEMKITHSPPDSDTNADSCLYCHGTRLGMEGMKTVSTDYGEMTFPVLSGWPNQGVGRINPDGTRGSCSSCHTRHRFDIEIARKPATCSECHKGPDVPAYGVYSVSKHGNIYSSKGEEWDFKAVPWTVGKDLTAPTCATCHASLLINADGDVISPRTHQMNDRLYLRIFGLIYAHAHPRTPDTTVIKNKAGLPLPTELTGEPVKEYLIDKPEQEKRLNAMQSVCLSCHSSGWVDGHFDRFENTVKTTNEMTLTATKILASAWDQGLAEGPADNDGIFNEAIEKKWVEQWIFYANSTRFASAMAGADYGAFANGRWYMSKNIQDMIDWMKIHMDIENQPSKRR